MSVSFIWQPCSKDRKTFSGGGSMDFWDGLDKSRRRICRDVIDRVQQAPKRDYSKDPVG